MTKKKKIKIEIQYFLFLFTDDKQALTADRRKNDDANLTIDISEADEEIIFTVEGLRVEKQRKPTPKPHIDIYILIENALLLLTELDSIKSNIIQATTLDRQIREAKDPTFTYDGSRVPLRIDLKSGFFKVSEMKADLSDINKRVIWERDKESSVNPNMNVEIEMKKTRLHLGSGSAWNQVIEMELTLNSFQVKIPFREFGQMYSCIKSSLRGFE